MTRQETIKALESIVANTKSYIENLGYEVFVKSNENDLVIYVRPVEDYVPDLYFHSKDVLDGFQREGEWTLQTTSYGTLLGDELKKYVDGITNGVNALHALKTFQETKEHFLKNAD